MDEAPMPDVSGVTGLEGGFVGLLGLEFLEATADRVVISWQVGPDLLQPHGLLHGGVHCSVVETAASVAGGLWYGERGVVVGVSNSTDFFRPVRTGELIARATPIHRGRTQQVWVVETTDPAGRLVARGQVRLANIPAEPALGHAAPLP